MGDYKQQGGKKMKKAIALLLSSMAVVSLTACGTSSSAGTAGVAEDTGSAAGTAVSSAAESTVSGDPVRIGLATVLTGERAMEGEYAGNAARIITEEINSAGGILGRPIEIVIEDGLGTDVGAVNAYRKLADDPSITAIIGSDNSNDNIAIANEAKQAEIVSTAQGSSPSLRDICNENAWLFQLRACEETMIDALIGYAVEELGYKNFAMIHDTETNSSDQARLFTQALEKRGIEPLVTVSFTTGTKDFTSHITKMQQVQPEAIIGACLFNEAAIIAEQIRAFGMTDMPIFGSNAWADPVTIELGGEALNGVYSAAAWVPNTTNEKGAAFSQKYQELYGHECAKAAAQIYDHVSIICEAITIAGSTDRAAVRDAMNQITDYRGAITVYDCSTNGDCGRGGLVVQIENEAAVVLQEIYSEKDK